MKRSDIKNEFHLLIDRIDNEALLLKFYKLLMESSKQNEGELWESLSEEQKQALLLAESESNYSKNQIDSRTQEEKHKKWLLK